MSTLGFNHTSFAIYKVIFAYIIPLYPSYDVEEAFASFCIMQDEEPETHFLAQGQVDDKK